MINKTRLMTSLTLLGTLGLTTAAFAAPVADAAKTPYNLSTEPASTAWQATPLVSDAVDTPTKAMPIGEQRVRPIGSISGKSRGAGNNVGGEATVTLNNDTPDGNAQLFGEIVGGVSTTRTR